jgi:uncharacterized membrane protein
MAESGEQAPQDREEPAGEEPASEEPASEEPASEEPASEEPASEEPAAGEPADGPPGGESASAGPAAAGHAGGEHQPGAGPGGERPGGRRLADPLAQLARLADQVAAGRTAVVKVADTVVPAWQRRTRGEHRWPVTLSIVAAIVLQVRLSDSMTRPLPHLLLPVLEGALGVGLFVANPVRIERRGPVTRVASIGLIMLITAANAISAVILVRAIVEALPNTGNAGPLLANGAAIWATNVIAFAHWYWEFDRGGPVRRAEGVAKYPDFMFPQMASPEVAPKDWEPYFVDYLYLSFTNATAFSPTDVMPMARWAKMTMAVQSAVALLVGVLVIARAVNILK